jgi:hypothetical protein
MSEQQTTPLTALDALVQRLEHLDAGHDNFAAVNAAMREAAAVVRRYRLAVHGEPCPVAEPAT